jgi:hypothetical protein
MLIRYEDSVSRGIEANELIANFELGKYEMPRNKQKVSRYDVKKPEKYLNKYSFTSFIKVKIFFLGS